MIQEVDLNLFWIWVKEDKTCVQGSLDDNRAIASGLAAQISSNPQLDIIRLPQDS